MLFFIFFLDTWDESGECLGGEGEREWGDDDKKVGRSIPSHAENNFSSCGPNWMGKKKEAPSKSLPLITYAMRGRGPNEYIVGEVLLIICFTFVQIE